MNHLNQLIFESTSSSDNSVAKPALVGLTRATTNLIYQDLVAVQETSQPVASLYGVKYLNQTRDLTFMTAATYSGEFSPSDRDNLAELSDLNSPSIKKLQYIKYQDVIFKAMSDAPFENLTGDWNSKIADALVLQKIRLVSEAAHTSKFEDKNTKIADAHLEIDRWQADVKSRKLKTEISIELAQDLESNGFNTPELIDDLLATQMAEEINKDIVQSLITVSSRYTVPDQAPNGIIDLTNYNSSVNQGRELYRLVCEMDADIQYNTAYSGTYVLASARVAAILASSGWLEAKDDQPDSAYGILKCGLPVYIDAVSPLDYLLVGGKENYGDNEMVGSLFYSPYTEGRPELSDSVDHVGTYKIITDPDSLQPKAALLIRYALSVNPYTMGLNDAEAKLIDCTNFDNFIGQSQMSKLIGVKLKPLNDKFK